MNEIIRTISESLTGAPLLALAAYENGLGAEAPIPETLRRRYDDTMLIIRAGRDIGSAERLHQLPALYASARREDRRRMLLAAVDQIVSLGVTADADAHSPAHATLEQLGKQFPKLVVEGPLHQQLTCKLATRLGFPRAVEIPSSVRELVVEPLIRALILVLRLGAATTRDAAVEGLGALLKLVDKDPATVFPPDTPPSVERQPEEDPNEYAARVKISDDYSRRLKRRRLMILTIAGDERARAEFCDQLAPPVAERLTELCASTPPSWSAVEDVLYERPDYLRLLPAVARQGLRLPSHPTALLCEAVRTAPIAGDPPPNILIAFARFQESVFRTIDTALRRGWKWNDFDADVAAAVRAIPPAMAGAPSVCNANVRATVAILRTAINLVKASGGASKTKDTLVPLFNDLGSRRQWANPGIVEGCFRGLPDLITDATHDDLTGPALNALFRHLRRRHEVTDLLETHQHVVANACFRRLLVSLSDFGRELHLLLPSEAAAHWDEVLVKRHVRLLLGNPTPANIRGICRLQADVRDVPDGPVPINVAQIIVAGMAVEIELLQRTAKLFAGWKSAGTGERLLLVRLLAAQLNCIARGTPEVRRHAMLRQALNGVLTAAMSDAEAMDIVWKMLSSLPTDAAEAADIEIQRFVAYRPPADGRHDLPEYVLAMISPEASALIAGAIAREIDLKLRYDVEHGRLLDIARILHEVTLRGPHESIFDHLLPRVVEPADRNIVLLFRKHVSSVLHSPGRQNILDHVQRLQQDLRKQNSPTLKALHATLDVYEKLTANAPQLWQALETGQTFALLEKLDALAEGEDPHRENLCNEDYKSRLVLLQEHVAHYVALPVANFGGRAEALRRAYAVAADIQRLLEEHSGLQPPERVLLVTLMQHYRDLFDRTRRWYCDEARRRYEAADKEHFWLFFCDPRAGDQRIRALRELVQHGPEQAQSLLMKLSDESQVNHLADLIGSEPPHMPGQRAKFEEYFVEWMASDLDVQSLKRVLKEHWPGWFRVTYGIITSFWWTSAFILLPCAIAVFADLTGKHHWEGLGFCVLTAAMIAAAGLALTQVLSFVARLLANRWRSALILLPGAVAIAAQVLRRHFSAGIDFYVVTAAVTIAGWLVLTELLSRLARVVARRIVANRNGHWFSCLLPRLARLTAVPMALIVEFDHSYEFPMNGTTPVLLLLMVISFVTTRFFVAREIVDRKERPGVVFLTPQERKRVRQIVAVALAHSFGIAVLLSAIFAPSHRLEPRPAAARKVHVAPGQPHRIWTSIVKVLDRLDAVSPPEHPHRRLLGLIPREVTLDLGAIAAENRYPLPPKVAEHLTFKFYPTIILTWTALGLFFGLFLEGFMKGEHLRVASTGEDSRAA